MGERRLVGRQCWRPLPRNVAVLGLASISPASILRDLVLDRACFKAHCAAGRCRKRETPVKELAVAYVM
jgi:hypothetical protein